MSKDRLMDVNRYKAMKSEKNDIFRAWGVDCIITLLIAIIILIPGSSSFAVEPVHNENPVSLEAESMDYDKSLDVYHAKGKAKIFYTDATLFADDMQLDNKNNIATAQGNTLLKTGEDSLEGDKMVFNIADKTGTVYNARAFYARNHFYIRGDEIQKTGENTYFIKQPMATTCDGDNPDWQITGSDMKVTIEGYGSVKNACFRMKGIPVLYSPYIIFPAKTKRQTGLLLPYLAYSRDKDGLDIELPFFWAISPQMDATFYQRYIEKRGFKEGMEFRYYLGAKSIGTFYGDFMEDTKHVTDETDEATNRDWQGVHKRWSYYLNHQTDFGSQFYVRTDLKKVSDKWYFRDFSSYNYYLDHYAKTDENDFENISFKGNKSLRYLDSIARLYKGWSHYNVTGLVDYTEDFGAVNNNHILQKYPEIFLTGIKQPLFRTPLYYELSGTYDYLHRGEGDQGHFADVTPSVSLPYNIFNYLKVTPQFALKETFWSRDDNNEDDDSKKKTDDRILYNASISLSSQLSRVFNVQMKNWEKIRHEIKPEIIYSYIPDVSSDNVPDYYSPVSSFFIQPIPTLSGDTLMEQNAVAWSLTNTLTTRVKDDTGSYSYLSFLRLRLFQTYDIHESRRGMDKHDPERRPWSDMGIEFDFSPHKYFSLRARDRYNVYSGWKQNSYDAHVRDWRGDSLIIGYRKMEDSIEEINLGLKAVITGNVYSTFALRHDLLNSRKIEHSIGLVYHKQCWGIGLDYSETEDEVRFLLRLSLAGFGKQLAQ